jgi:CRISPR type III-B/RAMP module-associated protein Cmr3
MAWKFIRLKPLKPFFFGKETNFKNTNYALSEYFPQQTQLIGALRLYWMEQNGLMKMHKHGRFCTSDKADDAKKFVGDAGVKDFTKNDNLGKINFISPMFISKVKDDCIEDALFEIPNDVINQECIYKSATPKKLIDAVSSKPVVILEDYDVKKGFIKGLGGIDFWDKYSRYEKLTCPTNYDEVFESYDQVGIALIDGKQVDEGKFYTKKSYMLKKGYEFGLLVDIDEEDLADDKRLKDGMITLGAENSIFSLKVTEIPSSVQTHPLFDSFQNTIKKSGTKIVLLSDSMLDNSIDKSAYFQIVPYKVPFRMMQRDSREQATKKSEEKLLVPKGSIYYFDKPSSLKEAQGAYAKMGFNQYLVLN